jgi:hypothetical protein
MADWVFRNELLKLNLNTAVVSDRKSMHEESLCKDVEEFQ